jgi:hypothetical protein
MDEYKTEIRVSIGVKNAKSQKNKKKALYEKICIFVPTLIRIFVTL